jgi:hypothetical protein
MNQGMPLDALGKAGEAVEPFGSGGKTAIKKTNPLAGDARIRHGITPSLGGLLSEISLSAKPTQAQASRIC